jgi:hypothetical protein
MKTKDLSEKRTYLIILIVSTSILVIVALLIAQFSRNPNTLTKDATQYLGLITIIAIGIERVMEGFWTVIDVYKESWWPRNLKASIEEFTSGLGGGIPSFVAAIDQTINNVNTNVLDANKIGQAKEDLKALGDKIKELEKATTDIKNVRRVLGASTQILKSVETKYPKIIETTDGLHEILTQTSDFLDTFKDNPGRRLISLYFGALIGVILAGILGLDVFIVAMGPASASSNLFPYWGVALTGILMGLGSSPTHEVIRAIQEVKNSKKM